MKRCGVPPAAGSLNRRKRHTECPVRSSQWLRYPMMAVMIVLLPARWFMAAEPDETLESGRLSDAPGIVPAEAIFAAPITARIVEICVRRHG